jgi:hypothetical protein
MSQFWPPELPNDPLSAADIFARVDAAAKVKGLDAAAEAKLTQALEAYVTGNKYAAAARQILDDAATPSDKFLLRLPIVRDLRSLWVARKAQAPLDMAESFLTKGKSLEAEAAALDKAMPFVRGADKALPIIGIGIDAGFSGFNQWSEDSKKGVALPTKITDTAVTAAYTAGLSYGGGALFAAGCSATGVGVLVAAGCAAVGGYLGGKVAGATSKYVDEGANWVREEATQGIEWAGGEISQGVSWAGDEVSKGEDWAKKHLCPWC